MAIRNYAIPAFVLAAGFLALPSASMAVEAPIPAAGNLQLASVPPKFFPLAKYRLTHAPVKRALPSAPPHPAPARGDVITESQLPAAMPGSTMTRERAHQILSLFAPAH